MKAAAALFVALVLAGCGSASGPAPSQDDVAAAIAAVRAELTTPIFRQASYTGSVDGSAVCVTVDIGTALGSADDVRYQHRTVTLPELKVGESQTGPCAPGDSRPLDPRPGRLLAFRALQFPGVLTDPA